tara:strand:- start:450 stop:1094 length:645 start_codon:yes stop_codon:yes gene_type:complete
MDSKYQRGKIYTIRCYDDNSKIYVGSTIETLSNRMGKHRADGKNEVKKNRILYQNVNNDWSNWYIELYENYPCNSLNELLKKEGEIIRKIGTLNKNISGRTEKEYREDNKEKVEEYYKQYYKEYYEKHYEEKLKYAKEYYENNKEKIEEYQKEYRENNKEKIKQKDKEYNQINKEKIAEQKKKYSSEKITCECGAIVSKGCLSKHLKRKIHTHK